MNNLIKNSTPSGGLSGFVGKFKISLYWKVGQCLCMALAFVAVNHACDTNLQSLHMLQMDSYFQEGGWVGKFSGA